eukprot:TRINITY_DN1318_c0_g1_i1.p1 TRINITY_DN1318_c0_g1~~TRINITY_DN1318_c0_g1_i1.p1  ORF type:complete len:231 (-),score=48.14 TRINITY_DN1318_c0_g1_i1:95-787(-)
MARAKRKASQQPEEKEEVNDNEEASQEATPTQRHNGEVLPDAVKAFLQIIMSRGALTQAQAEEALGTAIQSFGGAALNLDAVLRRANAQLKLMDLEIKGTRLQGGGGHVIYYAMANMNADEISKKHGTTMSGWRLDAFNTILDAFKPEEGATTVATGGYPVLSYDHMRTLKPKTATEVDYATFVQKLADDMWLKMEDKRGKSYSLGPRTYIELRMLLEARGIACPQLLLY